MEDIKEFKLGNQNGQVLCGKILEFSDLKQGE
jgi:hypothetical protein